MSLSIRFATFALVLGLLCGVWPAAANAFTLDTPLVRDGSGDAYCTIANLHPTKTCTLVSTSGLYGPLATGLPGGSTFPSVSFPVTTVGPGGVASLTGTFVGGCNTFNGCLCHFEVTGCPKAKVRASLQIIGGPFVVAE